MAARTALTFIPTGVAFKGKLGRNARKTTLAPLQVVLRAIVFDKRNCTRSRGASSPVSMTDGQPVSSMREFADGSRIFTANLFWILFGFFYKISTHVQRIDMQQRLRALIKQHTRAEKQASL